MLSRSGQTTKGYDRNRVIAVSHSEQPNSYRADITITNSEGDLTTLDFENYQVVLSNGMETGVSRTAWVANTAYAIDDIVIPITANGYQYRCAVAGTSHTSTEPTWPTDLGVRVADGAGALVWEMDGNTGDEYSRKAPLKVRVQELHSGRGILKCVLRAQGMPDQLKEDKAIAAYTQASDDTNTVKTLISAVCAAGTGLSSAYNGYTAITVVYDSEDSLINVFIPADHFSISINENRWDKITELLSWTGCKCRIGNDDKLHIFVPIITTPPSAETLRPSAAGDETNLSPYPDTGEANWQDVDDVTADEGTTAVRGITDDWVRDLYNLPSLSATSGIITSIQVVARCTTLSTPTRTSLKIAIKTGGTAYEGDAETVSLNPTWTDYSKTWTTNPNTGVGWTIANITALQIGVSLRRGIAGSAVSASWCTQLYVVVTFGYDYEYKFDVSGEHTFLDKAVRLRFIEPNKVIVRTPSSYATQYTGNATSATSYALDPKVKTIYGRFVSDAQCTSIAGAIIEQNELDAERGFADVLINVGQELWDYVKITDSRENDTRTGNVQFLQTTINLKARPPLHMSLAFGKVSLQSIMSNALLAGEGSSATGMANIWEVLERTWGFLEKIVDHLEDNQKMTQWLEEDAPDNLDDIADGTTYQRLLATQISAGKIYLSDVSTFKAGYDPSGKRRVFTAQPTTPYDVGDLWLDSSVIKRCTTARASGSYVAGDWTAQTLDSVADGTTYKLVLASELSAGRLSLTATNYFAGKFSGLWYEGGASGVDIDATSGINIYGVNNALTTRATKTGTIQCYVGSDGAIYAGAGAVILNANGAYILGQFLVFQLGATLEGYIYGTAYGLQVVAATGKNLGLGINANYTGSGIGFTEGITLLLLATAGYEVEGCLLYAGGASANLSIYSSGAWRTNT